MHEQYVVDSITGLLTGKLECDDPAALMILLAVLSIAQVTVDAIVMLLASGKQQTALYFLPAVKRLEHKSCN